MIDIHHADEAELAQVFALDNFQRGLDPERADAQLQRASMGAIVVATTGGKVVGFGVAFPWCGEIPQQSDRMPTGGSEVWWHLDIVAVSDEYRRRGVGSRLVDVLVHNGDGYPSVRTVPTDHTSKAFIAANGFEHVGSSSERCWVRQPR